MEFEENSSNLFNKITRRFLKLEREEKLKEIGDRDDIICEILNLYRRECLHIPPYKSFSNHLLIHHQPF